MKAIVYTEKGHVAYRDLPDPEPQAGEVLLRVRASGLCHTDIDVLNARYGGGHFPIVPGHEFAGEVVAIGADVEAFAIGDRVVVYPNLSCGTCRACRRGQENLCTSLGAYGISTPGGFGELVAIRAENLHLLGDLPFDQAALAEPMGCVLNGVTALAPAAKDETLIIGAGPIGLLLAIALRTHGVERITLADLDPSRLALARSFGFDAVENGGPDIAAMRRSMDICADATGRTDVAASLIDYTTDGGQALFFGVCPPEAKIEISPFEVFRRQLRLLGTHSLNRNIPEALQAIRLYGPEIERLVSHRLPLDAVADILSSKAPQGSLKVQAAL